MSIVIANCLCFFVKCLCYYIVPNSIGKIKSCDMLKGRRKNGNFDENITYLTDFTNSEHGTFGEGEG